MRPRPRGRSCPAAGGARAARCAGRIRRLDPAAQGDLVGQQLLGEQRDLVGWRGHVRVREHDEVPRGRQHARLDRGALAGMRPAQDPQPRGGSVRAGLRLRTRIDQGGRGVRGAVIHDEHVPRAELLRDTTTRTWWTLSMQPGEQLVECRAKPLLLVVGGQHDRDARCAGHQAHGRGSGARACRESDDPRVAGVARWQGRARWHARGARTADGRVGGWAVPVNRWRPRGWRRRPTLG